MPYFDLPHHYPIELSQMQSEERQSAFDVYINCLENPTLECYSQLPERAVLPGSWLIDRSNIDPLYTQNGSLVSDTGGIFAVRTDEESLSNNYFGAIFQNQINAEGSNFVQIAESEGVSFPNSAQAFQYTTTMLRGEAKDFAIVLTDCDGKVLSISQTDNNGTADFADDSIRTLRLPSISSIAGTQVNSQGVEAPYITVSGAESQVCILVYTLEDPVLLEITESLEERQHELNGIINSDENPGFENYYQFGK